MKKQFTILVCTFCMVFTGFAQVQLGSAINGTVVNGEFGRTVDMAGSGTRIVATAPNEGSFGTSKYYNQNTSESWEQMPIDNSSLNSVGSIARLSTNGMRGLGYDVFPEIFLTEYSDMNGWGKLDDETGISGGLDIDINSDGTRVIQGTTTAIHIYNIDNGQIVEMPGSPIMERADFVSISGDGNRIAISNAETNQYKTYEYDEMTSTWNSQPVLLPLNWGDQIAISEDGNRVAISSDIVFDIGIFEFETGNQIGDYILVGSNEGASLDISEDGNRVAFGAKGATKAAKVYEFDGAWTQINETIEFSGGEVALSNDGMTLAIGDPDYEVDGVGIVGQVRVYSVDDVNSVTNIEAANIEVFPNPTTGLLQLENVDASEVIVYDNVGKLVMSVQQPGTSMDITSLPAGFYFLKIATEEGIFSAKVIKE